jgi:hypothetical protein
MRYLLTSPKGEKYVVTPPGNGNDSKHDRDVANNSQLPPFKGARLAPDGHWYVMDSSRPGKFLRIIGRA